jgi:hypothetical protein
LFNAADVVFEDIVHELTHAYLDELCIGDAVRLKKKQLEEAFCELLSKHGETLIKQARRVFAKASNLQRAF